MTRDLGDRTDPATAVRRVRWFSPRARRRGAAVATVAETLYIADMTEACGRAYRAELQLTQTLRMVDAMLPLATTRAHQNDLLDLQNLLTGKAK